MVSLQPRTAKARSSPYSLNQPIPSPLHGRFPHSTPSSPRPRHCPTFPAQRPPLSPKSQATRSTTAENVQGRESITKLSFPPPLKRHARSLLPSAANPSNESESEDETEWQMREEVFVGEWKIGQSLGQGTSGSFLLSLSLAPLTTDGVGSSLNRHGQAREKCQEWSVCSDQKNEKITSRTQSASRSLIHITFGSE